MKKILFLTHQIPFPAVSGGLFKTAKLIEFLAEFNHVEVVVTDAKVTLENVNKFITQSKIKSLTRFPVDRKRNFANYLLSLLQEIPLSVYRNYSKSCKKEIVSRGHEFEIIFVDHFLMFQFVPDNFKGMVILHEHNAEYVLWWRYSELLTNPFLKVLVKIEAMRIRHYEKKIGDKASVIICSPNDQIALRKIGLATEKFVSTLHLGDTQLLELDPILFSQTKKKILFIGTLTWAANIDGLKWFLDTVWPEIFPTDAQIELSIVGKCDNQDIFLKWRDHPQIKWLGFVEDLNSAYQDSRLFIAPLRFGSGIKVKVVNALYRGLPVVTTPIGVEGLAVCHEEHLMISQDAKQMTKNILDLLEDKTQWSKLAKESRAYSHQHLSWEKVLAPIKNVIRGEKWQN